MSDPAARFEEVQAELKARREAYDERINSLLREGGDSSLPPLESLRDERARLMEQIRHSKDEGDAIMREFEGQEGVVNIYRVAARVQCAEAFASRAENYVRDELPVEVENVVDSDKRHSEDEVAAHITALQAKRDEEMKRIAALKERTRTQSEGIRNGPRIDRNEKNARQRKDEEKENEKKADADTMTYTKEQREANSGTLAKVKELRQEKSKLHILINEEKHRNSKRVSELNTRIRHSELANKSDARRCTELNTSNATLTTNSQILMGQLNSEHYGAKGALSQKQIAEARKEDEKAEARRERRARRAAKQQQQQHDDDALDEENENENDDVEQSQHGSQPRAAGYNRTDSRGTEQSNYASGVSSRRQSASKPPLVALKPTESQRNREAAVRAEMEQRKEEETSVQRSQRRGSEASVQRSQRHGSDASASASKPPRVASIPTESSRNRVLSRENSMSSKREY